MPTLDKQEQAGSISGEVTAQDIVRVFGDNENVKKVACAWNHVLNRDYEKAIHELRRAVELQPGHVARIWIGGSAF